jgi:hypothetical protein
MTKPAFRRVAVFVGTAALAAGSGVGVAASDDDAARSSAPRVESVSPPADVPPVDSAEKV